MKITKKVSRPKYMGLTRFFEESFDKQEAKCLTVSDSVYLTTFRAKIMSELDDYVKTIIKASRREIRHSQNSNE